VKQTRVERKYLLTLTQYDFFSNVLSSFMKLDNYSARSKLNQAFYPILSQYYDTSEFQFFKEKINGEWEHRKLRRRCYGKSFDANQSSFWEVKHKKGDLQIKIRKKADASLPTEGVVIPPLCLDYLNASKGLQFIKTIQVFYMRKAYDSFFIQEGKKKSFQSRFRVTFDKNILAMRPSETVERTARRRSPLLWERHQPRILMEVKSDSFSMPAFFEEMLKNQNIDQVSFSKYANCMQLILEELGEEGVDFGQSL